MEFKLLDWIAKDIRVKGNWLPQFRERLYDYREGLNMDEFQAKLYNSLFKRSKIEINENEYPFLLDRPIKQLVIWIHPDYNYSTDEIEEIIKQQYPTSDYIVWVNLPHNMSIPKIPHYHALISESQPKYYLKKLRVFIRHGNREPILKLKKYEDIESNSYDLNAPLIESGKKTCYRVAQDLKKIYKFKNRVSLKSSPIQRCIDSAKQYAAAFGINDNIKTTELLFGAHFHSKPNYWDRDDVMEIWKEIEDLCEYFDYKPDQPYSIYALYCSLLCYQEKGIHIDQDIIDRVSKATDDIYNIYSHESAVIHFNAIFDTINKLDSGNEVEIYSTHDVMIMIIAKAIIYLNSMKMRLPFPKYCSNVRIEEWESDNSQYVRIYYDNLFIGDLIK